jgi:aspartyl-tRNA synthetase
MTTGRVEVAVEAVTFSNPCSKTLPFRVGDPSVREELRLQYRYLDLRSETLQRNLRARAEVAYRIRECLRALRFVEVETPYLFRPSPEGAKEFAVRTRWPNLWYSLPQSPQQYKQLLMMGGMDRYFQIARCFRDEDMRLERQPEFTQVDLEMSFAEEADVMAVTERVIAAMSSALHLPEPAFERMLYRDAMRLYGIDKPDLRITSKIESVVTGNQAHHFKALKLSRAPAPEKLREALRSDSELAVLVDGKWQGAAMPEGVRGNLSAQHPSGVVLARVGASEMHVCAALGKLRLTLDAPADPSQKRWLWVTEFPMFELQTDGTWKAAHHPFTAPALRDEHLVRNGGPAAYHAHARAYDIVLNGVEVGGGSVRNHDASMQLAVLRLLGIDESKARSTLGHMLDGLEMGAPPHAGLAFGLDRLMMVLLDASSLKDVIAFPKAADGKELMVGSPSPLME